MRKLSSILVGLGVFLIVAGVLVRFYAYPTLAKTPPSYGADVADCLQDSPEDEWVDCEGATQLYAEDAQVFNSDPEVLATETTDLSILSITMADSGAETPDGVDAWVNTATITRPDGSVFQRQRERAAVDVVTAENVDCDECETWVEVAEGEREPITREGQMFKFPFNTQKQDYDQWDGSTQQAVPAVYSGEEKIDGVTVYKFVQIIEPQVVETREVPASVFGSADTAAVDAEMWYGMTRIFYIEPVTGAPVNRVEERMQELRYDGTTVPAFNGTVQYTDEQVEAIADIAGGNATMLGAMRGLVPLLLGLIGLVLIGLGVFVGLRGRGTSGGQRKQTDKAAPATTDAPVEEQV